MIGYAAEEVIGKSIHSLVHSHSTEGSEQSALNCPLESVLEDRTTRRGDSEYFRRKNGARFPIEFAAVPLVEEGQVVGSVVTFSDISARKKAEEELYAAKEAAETANRSKSQFLANMSHELRTPLNAIIGYSELLVEEAEDAEESLLPDILKIHKAGKHLLALINDVLDLSKIEAGKMDLHLESFDVVEMVHDVANTIQSVVLKNNNRLDLEMGDALGEMYADFTKVRQNLFNLLSNAAKFTTNGVVTLAVFTETREGVDGYSFRVTDTGIGISSDQQKVLFAPFSQADVTTAHKFGGTGLGLAIARRICTLMGGDINFTSEPGKGSVFVMWLPSRVTVELGQEANTGEERETSMLENRTELDHRTLTVNGPDREGVVTTS